MAGIEGDDDIKLNLYPNPNNGIFNLTLFEMPEGEAQIRLLDELGQVIYACVLQNQSQSFDFSYLKAATYYFQLTTGGKSITKTFIITHKY
jgi:hypothetical protein